MEKLKAMVKLNLVKRLPNLTYFCEGEVYKECQFGNAHRLPFDKSTSRCQGPLELIHCNLIGPTRTSFVFKIFIYVNFY